MTLKPASWGIIILIVLSFLIRVWRLDNLSLFGDEIDVGYQAYSLLKTRHDYRGYFLPFYTESLSESRAPLLIYLTIPFIKIFGLTTFGVRLLPVLAGVISIFFLYKLVKLLSQSESLAIFSATALSLMPWHFHYSRAAFEVTLLIGLILAAIYFFYLFTHRAKNKFLYFSIILFGLSFYTYNTANIFVPLLVIYLLISNWSFIQKQLNIKTLFIAILMSLILIAPLGKEILWGKAAERISIISIFKSSQIVDKIIDKRTSFSSLDPHIERFFHNKVETIGKTFLHNLVNSFSANFLFFGDMQTNPRHSLPGFGLLFLSFLPFLIIGLIHLNIKDKTHRFFLIWLLISPLPAAFTLNGGTHPTRTFLMTIPLAFFIALGFNILKQFRIIPLILFLTLGIEIVLFTHEYFVHYPSDNAKLWNFGYQQLFSKLDHGSNRLFISNSNYNSLLPYLFYNQIIPTSIHLDDHEKQNIQSDMPGFKISESVYFINDWRHHNDIFEKVNQFSQPGDIFVFFQLNEIPGDMDLSQQPVSGFTTIKTVYNPNHTILAQIIQKI